MHAYISRKIISFLFQYYYIYLIRLYDKDEYFVNENLTLHLEKKKKKYQEIFDTYFILFKPTFFVYLQFYFFYLFFYNLTYSHYWNMIFSLHGFHICRLAIKDLIKRIDYNPTPFLNISKYLYSYMIYLFCMYGMIVDICFYKKIFFTLFCMPFYILTNMRYIYKKRLKSIQNQTFTEQNILIFTSDKEKIKEIYNYCKYFTFSTFLWIFTILYRIMI